jgi:MFS family permease
MTGHRAGVPGPGSEDRVAGTSEVASAAAPAGVAGAGGASAAGVAGTAGVAGAGVASAAGAGPAAGVAPGPGSWRVILSGRRGRLLVGLTMAEFVAAVQILIVITVLPAVVRQLGGIRLYGLALSVTAVAGIGAAPVTVRLLDRFGARLVVPAGAVLFSGGALGAGLAGRMAELVLARFAEGAGVAALGAVAITSVGALYEEAQRPKVMVLGNLAWIIPSVAGPALGSLFVATVGWRWAFTAQLPLLAVAMALAGPNLGLLGPATGRSERGIAGASVLLVAGLLAVLAGPAVGGAAGIALTTAGIAVAALTVRRILPPGLLAMRAGLPVATMAVSCCAFAYFAVDGFVPLLLTSVDHRSVPAAGVVITLAILSWTLGGMAQARLARRGWAPPRVVTAGTALIGTGICGTALGLLPGLWLAPYLAWPVAGFGMGLAYTGAWLAVLSAQAKEAAGLAGPLAADRLGTALGAGTAGACIALLTGAGLGVGNGIGLGLAVALAAVAALARSAQRMV